VLTELPFVAGVSEESTADAGLVRVAADLVRGRIAAAALCAGIPPPVPGSG